RQRRRPHAAPGARRRGRLRPGPRRAHRLHLRPRAGGVRVSETSTNQQTVSALDTVERAGAAPDTSQPWAELGLKQDEYERIRDILDRRPTSAELAMYSVMWSEHCSYKSSKVHLRRFGDLPSETPLGKTLAGIGENAGVIEIGQGWGGSFKGESHNHPR